MSIIISDLSYHYPNEHVLFEHLNLSISAQNKVSIIGNNGVGKSTLLKLIAGSIHPSQGSIMPISKPYYIPQQIEFDEKTVAEALSVSDKLTALLSIINGSVFQSDYDILADDWDIENRCRIALDYWQLSHLELTTPMSQLSGGEKTKVFLSGLLIHDPDIVLLDEPTNHLDYSSRELLYEYIDRSHATIVIVSHDITLLNLLSHTYELSSKAIKLYGGNYSFYKEQKEIEDNALNESISAEEKSLRLSRKKAQEVKQRQDRRDGRGERNKDQVIRILRRTMSNKAQNTGAKLEKKHSEIIDDSRKKLNELKDKRYITPDLKIDVDNTSLHKGKLLFVARDVNHRYAEDGDLWSEPLNIEFYSGDRLHIQGKNGSGKTTLIRILKGDLVPSEGTIKLSDFSYIHLDQEYTPMNVDVSVLELAEEYNHYNLADHEVKLRLNRALFPVSTWDKKCTTLSGGEKIRLYLCCLMLSNHVPDLIILDEPTNNLDIASLEILTDTMRNYKGSLIVISHDHNFVSELNVDRKIILGNT